MVSNYFPSAFDFKYLQYLQEKYNKFVADICHIWTYVALFSLQELMCAACQEYKSLQTSVFSSVALGLQAYQHQLTLELISLGSLF